MKKPVKEQVSKFIENEAEIEIDWDENSELTNNSYDAFIALLEKMLNIKFEDV